VADKRRGVRAAAYQLESKHVEIKCERALEIAYAEMDVADARRIGDAVRID
jgi:hypothetical protein